MMQSTSRGLAVMSTPAAVHAKDTVQKLPRNLIVKEREVTIKSGKLLFLHFIGKEPGFIL